MIPKKARTILAVAIFLIASLPSLAETIETGKGTLKLGLILQSTASYTQSDLAPATSLTMKRARLLMFGEIIPGKVKYFIQTETVGSPSLLDMKLQFYYIPKTEVAIGRFLPNFTYYMPMSTAKLDLINYPLMVLKYGMWRQVGLQTTTTTTYVDFNVGLFNGYPSNNWTDNNAAKDLLLRVAAKPNKSFLVFGNAWLGNELGDKAGVLSKDLYGGGILFDRPLSESSLAVSFRGECLWGKEDTKEGKVNSRGLYANAGLKINPQLEFLVRYDNFDPNTKTGENGLSWITAGVNYYLQGQNVMFYLNYIKKIDQVAAGLKDPKDDEVVLQVQVFF